MNEQRARLALLAKSKMAQQSGGLFNSMLPLMAMSGTDNMLNMMLVSQMMKRGGGGGGGGMKSMLPLMMFNEMGIF